jgi:hypothetical protein
MNSTIYLFINQESPTFAQLNPARPFLPVEKSSIAGREIHFVSGGAGFQNLQPPVFLRFAWPDATFQRERASIPPDKPA